MRVLRLPRRDVRKIGSVPCPSQTTLRFAGDSLGTANANATQFRVPARSISGPDDIYLHPDMKQSQCLRDTQVSERNSNRTLPSDLTWANLHKSVKEFGTDLLETEHVNGKHRVRM